MEQMPRFDRMQQPERRNEFSARLSRQLGERVETHKAIYRRNLNAQRYMTLDPRSRADSLGKVGQYLRDNPSLLIDFNYLASMKDKNTIALLVQPNHPFVLSRVGALKTTVAMVPGISCTEVAIRDLFDERTSQSGQYGLFTVGADELETRIWEMAERDSRKALPYRRSDLSPEQYIAAAATGMLNNEVFKIPVTKLLER